MLISAFYRFINDGFPQDFINYICYNVVALSIKIWSPFCVNVEDIRSERAWTSNMIFTGYAKVSKIRCPWGVAPCRELGYWARHRIELVANFNLNKSKLATSALSCIQTTPPTGGFFVVRILRSANSFLRTADSETNNVIVSNVLYAILRI